MVRLWDYCLLGKISKKPKQKSRYLGTAKTKNGEISKPHEKAIVSEKSIIDFGDSYFIKQVIESNDFMSLLKNSFNDFDTILALIFYQIVQGDAMYNCQDWYEGNVAKILFPSAKLKSQSISRIINYLSQDSIQSKFFKAYINSAWEKSA